MPSIKNRIKTAKLPSITTTTLVAVAAVSAAGWIAVLSDANKTEA